MKIMINGVTVDATPEQEAAMLALSSYVDQSSYNTALQLMIDSKAQEKAYADGVSCASYFNSTNELWAAESAAFIQWRDNCFEYGYDYLARVQNGEITDPSIDAFLNGLPELVWPVAQ